METKRILSSIVELPIVQWGLVKTDLVLQILNEAVLWTIKGSSEKESITLPWLVFLPILLTVQIYRLAFSMLFIVTYGHCLTRNDTSSFIVEIRNKLNSFMKEEDKEPSTTESESKSDVVQNKAKGIVMMVLSIWPVSTAVAILNDLYNITYKQIIAIYKAITDVDQKKKNEESSTNVSSDATHDEEKNSDSPETDSYRHESEQHNDNQQHNYHNEQEHHG